MNGKEENGLNQQHRQYCHAKMKECLNDAEQILGDRDIVDHWALVHAAVALFDKRVSPFHYYKQNIEDEQEDKWKDDPATDKQKAWLRAHDIEHAEAITKGDASKLIDLTKKHG